MYKMAPKCKNWLFLLILQALAVGPIAHRHDGVGAYAIAPAENFEAGKMPFCPLLFSLLLSV